MPETKTYVSQEPLRYRETGTLVRGYSSLTRDGTGMVLTAPVIGNILVCNWTIFQSVNAML